MPRTPLVVQSLTPNAISDALTVVTASTTNNHEFPNTGSVGILCVNKAAAAPVTITVVSVADSILGRVGDLVQAIAAGETRFIGPLNKNGFNQSTGLVHIDVDVDETDFEFFAIAV